MKTKKPRNRAAQDATLINVRALRRALAKLTARVAKLERRLADNIIVSPVSVKYE